MAASIARPRASMAALRLFTRSTHTASRRTTPPSGTFFNTSRPKPTTIKTALSKRFYRYGVLSEGPPASQGSTRSAVYSLIGINAAVFGTWIYATSTGDKGIQQKLYNNALISWPHIDSGRYWTMVTSAFSHKDFGHFFFNMFAMYTFGNSLVYAAGLGIGATNVFLLATGAAVASSATFLYMRKRPAQNDGWGPFARAGPAAIQTGMGASGVTSAFVAVAACLTPFQPMMIFPVPIPMPMWVMSCGFFALDYYLMESRPGVAHDAHLGGAAFGAAFYAVFLRRFGGVSQLLRGRY